MRIDALLPRQSDDCIECGPLPKCVCGADEECSMVARDCYTCGYFTCVAKQSSDSSTSSGGVSKGALAGAIVGVIIFLALALALFLWYRRSQRLRRANAAAVGAKPEVPASAETVLSRPDPIEKSTPSPTTEHNTVRVYSTSSNTTIDLDPESQHSAHSNPHESSRASVPSNPFDDQNSIQTAGSEGTNVIPIALVAPESQRSSVSSQPNSSSSSGPVRPPRSPELTLNYNLDHINVSGESMRPPAGYAISQVSGVSSRNSYMSNASYSSDLLNEAPMIITPKRQVIGVGKAEFVNAPLAGSSEGGLRPSTLATKPTVTSPLAAKSFGPSDVTSEVGSEEDPFNDKHYSTVATVAPSPAASTATFGQRESNMSGANEWGAVEAPLLPWDRTDNDHSRPSSMSTQAGSVIGIENATRVNVGLGGAASAQPRTLYRQTMARLVSPNTASSSGQGSLQDQQQKAYALAQARAQEQAHSKTFKRVSGSSVLSAASTRADSILESFPFVPPSPISDRPVRTPPVSPLSQQSFSNVSPPSTFAQKSPSDARSPTVVEHPTPVVSKLAELDTGDLPAPPDRRTLGLSTGSQLSTASSGLGSFPFQIDSGNGAESVTSPSSYNTGRQRASLDTLAITSDLSSYPLGFDRASDVPPVPRI